MGSSLMVSCAMMAANWLRYVLRRAVAASLSSRREPLVATITGSTTMFLALYCFSLSAITSMRPVEETIPVFTASGKMSVKMQSSWLARNSGVDSRMP